jgi:hypothetical protein
LRDRHRHDLGGEATRVRGFRSFAVALERVPVLRLAIDVILGGDDFAGMAHVALFERAPQTVVDHRVDQLAISHAQSLADAWQQVGRIAHRLHAAGDRDVDIAGANRLCRQHHRFEARPAHLVDCERGHMVRETTAQRCLPRRRLAQPGRHDVPHDAFVDDRWIDGGASDGLAHRDGAADTMTASGIRPW